MTDQVNEAWERVASVRNHVHSMSKSLPDEWQDFANEIVNELSAAYQAGINTHPARGVVDEAMVERLAAWLAKNATVYIRHGEACTADDYREHARSALQAAALPAVPDVDPMAAFFAKRKEDEAQVFIARAKHALREILVALEDEDYEESRSLILDALGESATPAHDQPEGTASSSEDEQDESCSGCFRHSCNGECMHGD